MPAEIGRDQLRIVDQRVRRTGLSAATVATQSRRVPVRKGPGDPGCNRAGGWIQRNLRAADHTDLWPILEAMVSHDLPIWLHPARDARLPDYLAEQRSRYEIWWTLGWPYETSAAMARLVFSGAFDRLPGLKVITHHLGGLVPYLEGRVGPGWDQIGARTSDEDLVSVKNGLRKRPYDYFKDFYGDTAVEGARAATVCGLAFFGPDHVLFASDCPFDKEKGPGYIRSTIAVIDSLGLADADKEKICYRNAEAMFRLAPAD